MDDQAQQDQPLFQNSDDQERVYAPQQTPGAARPAADDHPERSRQVGGPLPTTVPPAAPTSTTAPELTLTGPVDQALTGADPARDDDMLDDGERRG